MHSSMVQAAHLCGCVHTEDEVDIIVVGICLPWRQLDRLRVSPIQRIAVSLVQRSSRHTRRQEAHERSCQQRAHSCCCTRRLPHDSGICCRRCGGRAMHARVGTSGRSQMPWQIKAAAVLPCYEVGTRGREAD